MTNDARRFPTLRHPVALWIYEMDLSFKITRKRKKKTLVIIYLMMSEVSVSTSSNCEMFSFDFKCSDFEQ